MTAMFHPKYRPDIDGLRAVAVILVVGFHLFPNFIPGGFVGVDIFFVISGYLISTILFNSLDKGVFTYREFYIRRIRRIFPALIVVLTTVAFAGWFVMMADDYKRLGWHLVASGGFFANIAFWQETNYFDTRANLKPLLHIWSLGIEEQFYILWPFILVCAWRLRNKSAHLLTAITCFSFLGCLWLTIHDQTEAYYSPLSRFWELSAGGLIAWLTIYRPHTINRNVNLQAIAGFLFLVAALFFY